jgi:hypothetical protein
MDWQFYLLGMLVIVFFIGNGLLHVKRLRMEERRLEFLKQHGGDSTGPQGKK